MRKPDYKNNVMHIEKVSAQEIAETVNTPVYVYSKESMTRNLVAYTGALKKFGQTAGMVCYAVKANSNLSILRHFSRMGAGFDIVSGGELERVLAAGGNPEKIVFSGVGKREEEIITALEAGIYCFNVESEAELWMIEKIASNKNKKARISIRVNPDVDARTHAYISTGLKENKFGVAIEDATPLYLKAAQSPHLEVNGVDCHIGSQLTTLEPFIDAMDRVLLLVDELEKHDIHLSHLNMGGGLGIRYQNEQIPSVDSYIKAMCDKLADRPLRLILEPGRSIIANAGVLLMKVILTKQNGNKRFMVTDAGMNDMMRPALYHARHKIEPVLLNASIAQDVYDIVGPVCESSDCFLEQCSISAEKDSYLALLDAGAYGMTMASNYNSRPKAAEIMVDNDKWKVIRRRETINDLLAMELPDD